MLKLILVIIANLFFFCFHCQEDSKKRIHHSILFGSSYYSKLEKMETSILELKNRFVLDFSYRLNVNLTTKKKHDFLVGTGIDLFVYNLELPDTSFVNPGITPLLVLNTSYKTEVKKDINITVGLQLKKNLVYFGRSASIGYGVNIGLEKQFANIALGVQYFQRLYYTGFSREISGLRLCLGF